MLSNWHNEFIPEPMRTRDGVYRWAGPQKSLEQQPGNAAIVEAVFAKEIVAQNRAITAQEGDLVTDQGWDSAVERLRVGNSSLIRNQGPAAWQQAYGETPLLEAAPGAAARGWRGSPQATGTVIRSVDGDYMDCTVGQLREAIDKGGQGHVLEYLHDAGDHTHAGHLDYAQRHPPQAAAASNPEVS